MEEEEKDRREGEKMEEVEAEANESCMRKKN
jgi:hypothetical protein